MFLKYASLIFIIVLLPLSVLSQPKSARIHSYDKAYTDSIRGTIPADTIDYSTIKIDNKIAVYVGFLNGGGSLIGADIEYLFAKHFGVQVGVGFIGYGFAINFHFKPEIKSSGISLSYWHQGIGDSFFQSMIGPTYVFRGKKWFTFQVGLGLPLDTGPAIPVGYVVPPVLLFYSIGAYFTL